MFNKKGVKMKEVYDSKPETKEHIKYVSKALTLFCNMLKWRAKEHDKTKLNSPELKYFDRYTPLLKKLKYGSKEYSDSLKALAPALEHHYKENKHHPEHYPNGVGGMNLVDIVEMFCDWLAASKRTKKGSMSDSIKISCKRFNISPQLEKIFYNTLIDLKLHNY